MYPQLGCDKSLGTYKHISICTDILDLRLASLLKVFNKQKAKINIQWMIKLFAPLMVSHNSVQKTYIACLISSYEGGSFVSCDSCGSFV